MIISNPAFVRSVEERRLLPEDEIRDALGAPADASRLLRHMVREQLVPRAEAARMWADGFGVAYVDLEQTLFQSEIVQRLPRATAERLRMIPIYKMGDAVTTAMANPADREAIAAAAAAIGAPISVVAALPEQIDRAIEVEYHSFNEFAELKKEAALASALSLSDKPLTREQLERVAGQEVIIKLVNTLLLLSLKEGASDIHMEPHEAYVLVRFRIDGVLHERARLSPEVYPRFLMRLKVIAGLDITERRRPQDGRITLDVGGEKLDFRLSTIPALYGEVVALRLLAQMQMREVPSLDDLQISHSILTQVRGLIHSPNGVFFVTGPTGSGKTTTVFSVLKEINQPGLNIMTVEDPVEYRLKGVTQVPINRAVGVDFPSVLRAFLRQDPNVLLIGEIRDLETARIATEAALTGHLVLATLHTNDAVQATTRLIEIGVEPFLVGPSIIGIMAQRLVRTICSACREQYDPGDEVLDRLFERDRSMRPPFFRGRGCPACGNTGYRGRLALHEMLMVDDEIRHLITNAKPPMREVYAAARASGYMGLRYDGLKKVLRGLTTLEEVDRVAPAR